MNKVLFFRWLTLLSYFGLMLTLLAWILLAPHSENFPTFAMLVLGVVPLMFPLRGLLHARPYTHAWTSFLMLFYFAHAVGELYSGDSMRLYPLLAVIFSFLCFCGTIFFIKLDAKKRKTSQNRHA